MPVSFGSLEAREVVRVLAALAACDGGVGPQERDFLARFTAKHQVDVGEGEPFYDLFDFENADTGVDISAFDLVSLPKRVKNPEKRRQMVRVCLELALCDRDYEPAETAFIARIARVLKVSDAELIWLTIDVRNSITR